MTLKERAEKLSAERQAFATDLISVVGRLIEFRDNYRKLRYRMPEWGRAILPRELTLLQLPPQFDAEAYGYFHTEQRAGIPVLEMTVEHLSYLVIPLVYLAEDYDAALRRVAASVRCALRREYDALLASAYQPWRDKLRDEMDMKLLGFNEEDDKCYQ